MSCLLSVCVYLSVTHQTCVLVVNAKPQWSPSPAPSLRRLTCSEERSRSHIPLLPPLRLAERGHLPPLSYWYADRAVCVRRGKGEREVTVSAMG